MVEWPVRLFRRPKVRNTGEMKTHVNSLEARQIRIRLRQIQSQCGLAVRKGCAVFTECENRISASRQLLAKLPTDKSGCTAD